MINDMLELVQRPYLTGKDGFKYTAAAVARHITFPVQAKLAVASRENLEILMNTVPSSSLTIYTPTITWGVSEEDVVAIENQFDTTRMFVDVLCNTPVDGKVRSQGAERCAIM